jgi:hypothetical protein
MGKYKHALLGAFVAVEIEESSNWIILKPMILVLILIILANYIIKAYKNKRSKL